MPAADERVGVEADGGFAGGRRACGGVGAISGPPRQLNRTLWPTRDGWWCLAAAIGLGFAAMNTGNNLLYLLVSLLLGLIVVSGILSEQSIRRLHFAAIRPHEIYAGRAAVFGVRVVNRKRWRPSYSVAIEVVDGDARPSAAYLPKLEGRGERLITWQMTVPHRGRQPFPWLRIVTRFPFGFFVKAAPVRLEVETIVYPAVRPIDRDWRRALGGGDASAHRRGRGSDLYNLREYRPGDEPRLIHWRSTAKTGLLTVRELEADTTVDTRIVLDAAGSGRARLEAGLSEAASLAEHLIRRGGGVEMVGPGLLLPLGRGDEHRRRILTALALYELPDAATAPSSPGGPRRTTVREIRVVIG